MHFGGTVTTLLLVDWQSPQCSFWFLFQPCFYPSCLISALVPAGLCQTKAANSSQAGQNACQSSCLLLQDAQCQNDWVSSSPPSRSRAALNNRSASPSRPASRACLTTRKWAVFCWLDSICANSLLSFAINWPSLLFHAIFSLVAMLSWGRILNAVSRIFAARPCALSSR